MPNKMDEDDPDPEPTESRFTPSQIGDKTNG